MKIRRKTAVPRNAGAVLPMLACLAAQAAEGGFLEDAKTDLVLRNYYFNRDFRDHDAGKSLVDEWAQGFILKFSSGYTPGTVGVGLDAIGLFGVKLNSGRGTSNSELLPLHDDGRAADNYGRVGVAAKLRVSASELKIGEMLPDIPLLRYDDGRLLPQTFRGFAVVSRELPGLALQAGRFDAVSLRNSADMQDLSAWSAPTQKSDGFNYAGAEYRFNRERTQLACGTGNWRTSTGRATPTCCTSSVSATGPWAPTSACSSTATTAPRAPERSTAIPSTACFPPASACTPSTLACRRSAATAAGNRSTAAVGGAWATTCSTATSPTPTNAPGRCATTTISSASAGPA